MRSIYVTGGGKCGTHLVANFLHANWPNSTLYPTEFKTWAKDLPGHLQDKFLFHCANTAVEPFKEICPSGTLLCLVRNPAQQYVAWLCTFSQGLLYPGKSLPEEMHVLAKRCVIHGFDVAAKADVAWRLEDFTESPERRLRMVGDLLGSESLAVDAAVTVPKTRFGWGNGVHRVTQTEYANILTDAEIAAFDRSDINASYPHWKQGLLMLDKRDEERVLERFRFTLSEAQKVVVNRLKRKNQDHELVKVRPVEEMAIAATKDFMKSTASPKVAQWRQRFGSSAS